MQICREPVEKAEKYGNRHGNDVENPIFQDVENSVENVENRMVAAVSGEFSTAVFRIFSIVESGRRRL